MKTTNWNDDLKSNGRSILEDVKAAMQPAEEICGVFDTAEYIALMALIIIEAETRIANIREEE